MVTVSPAQAGAVLTIDLGAIVSNYRLLSSNLGNVPCAAVVKADAYGLGAAEVASALERAGCRTFFVAHVSEGIDLRRTVSRESRICVLNGLPRRTEADFVAADLIPVINSKGELLAWRDHARTVGERLPVVLQVDSGMSRLGLAPSDVSAIAAEPTLLEGLSLELVMSHLACADEPEHEANGAQLREFKRLRAMLPPSPASLANSSGVFLGEGFHFDMVRPGAALYGLNPTPQMPNPMRPVVTLCARVLQVRDAPSGTGIGYGHVVSANRTSRLATISLGYADGWPRNAGTHAFFGDARLPFIGRVSMDSIILDAPDGAIAPAEGDMVDLICARQTVDDVARTAGTIGYEILTRFGRRFHRRYLSPDAHLNPSG